jgi:hypothetical protein
LQKRYYSVSVNLNEKGEIDEQDKLWRRRSKYRSR